MTTLRTFSKRISSLALVTVSVLSLPGCMADSDHFAEENTAEAGGISFEDFMETEVTYDQATGHYVVEGDIVMNELEDVERYWAENLQPSALTIHTFSSGARNRWSDAQKFDISYCIDKNSFSASQYADVQAAMRAATGAWERSAMVNFVYKSDQDTNCTDNNSLNSSVKFEVHYGGTSTTANAWMHYPYETIAFERELMIYSGAWNSSPKTLTGILMHELGHGLGFPHEHDRTECKAPDAEALDVEELTDLDVESVMFYRQLSSCGATWRDYSLSTSDRNGAALVYGAPAPTRPLGWQLQGPNDMPFLLSCSDSGSSPIASGGPNYPLDGNLDVCSAAFHAGVTSSSGGNVLVTKKSDAPARLCTSDGSALNCNDYPNGGSFTVAAPTAIPACPTNMVDYRGTNAERVCKCANGGSGSVWGTGTYKDDSNVCRAAVHAGVIPSTGGVLRVAATAGASSYTGTTQNGVTTSSYGSSWSGSFTVKSAPAITSWWLDYHGGSGGGAYSLSCDTGSVAVGLNGRSGSYVDKITPVCAPVNTDLSLGTAYSIGSAGGTGGGQYTLSCPTNEALVGIYGQSGGYVDRIGIRCQSLSNFKQSRTSVQGSAVGGSGGGAFDNVCPKGFAIKSFSGRSGSFVDAVQAECVAIP